MARVAPCDSSFVPIRSGANFEYVGQPERHGNRKSGAGLRHINNATALCARSVNYLRSHVGPHTCVKASFNADVRNSALTKVHTCSPLLK
jgi:hypothetical protein